MSYEQLIAYIDGLYADGSLSEQDYVDIINYIVSNGDPTSDPRDLMQIRRGNKADLPNLAQGEMAYTLDTEELFVGGLSGNIKINSKAFLNVKEFGVIGDGVTSDTVAMQSILDTYGDSKIIYMPPSTYYFDDSLNVPSNVNIFGHPSKTILLTPIGETIFRISSKQNINISNMVIQGDTDVGKNSSQRVTRVEAGSSHITFKNVTAYDVYGSNFFITASDGAPNSFVTIENCKSYRAGFISFFAYKSHDILFKNCYSYDAGDAFAVQHKSCWNSVMDGVKVDTPRAYGIFVSLESGDVVNQVINNVVMNCTVVNQGLNGNTGYPDNASIAIDEFIDGKCINNIVKNGTGVGIKVFGITNGSLFDGNHVQNCGAGGIRCSGSKNIISNNTVRDCATSGITGDIIESVVDSNVLIENNTSGFSNYGSIYLESLSKKTVISNNKCIIETAGSNKANIVLDSTVDGDFRIVGNQLNQADGFAITTRNIDMRAIPNLTITNNGEVKILLTTGWGVVEDVDIKSGLISRYLRDSIPTLGTWKIGDIILRKTPVAGGILGWINTQDGEFGTGTEPVFKQFGSIQA